MKEYMDSGLYFVRRKDWADRRKDRCDKCENSGYDYIITEKNRKRGNDHGE
jgi:mRNA interferase MazF